MIPLSASLSLSYSPNSRNSNLPCICCSSGVVVSSSETNNGKPVSQLTDEEVGDQRAIPNSERRSTSTCASIVGRCFSRILPGHHRRQSEQAAQIFLDFLQKQFPEDVVTQVLEQVDWDSIKIDIRKKHIDMIKALADRLTLEASISQDEKLGSENEGLGSQDENFDSKDDEVGRTINWVLKLGPDWKPEIQVERRGRDAERGNHIEAFDREKIKEKLKTFTEATDEEIEEIIRFIEVDILNSKAAFIVASSNDIDTYVRQEIAKNHIQLKALDEFKGLNGSSKAPSSPGGQKKSYILF